MPNKNRAELFGCLGYRDWTSMCGIDATGTVIEENDRKRPVPFGRQRKAFNRSALAEAEVTTLRLSKPLCGRAECHRSGPARD